MPSRSFAALALALALAGAPARAQPAGPPTEAPSERVFSQPYGDSADRADRALPKAPEPAAPVDALDPRDEDLRPRPLRTLGISGMGAGSSVAALGGLFLLGSLGAKQESAARGNLRSVGFGFLAAGGALFAAGAVLFGIDAAAVPAPTPDRRGAQLLLALRF